VQEFGKLNVLVNNAGIVNGSPLHKFDLTKWQQILDVNLTGTFLGMQVAVEPMIAAGGGSIINVSSIEGLRGAPWAHGYVASKWGVRGLAKSAALELASHNIRVNSIHPGLVRTPMTKNIPDDMVTIPLGRPADPIEVSTFVLFLASDESSYATGTSSSWTAAWWPTFPTRLSKLLSKLARRSAAWTPRRARTRWPWPVRSPFAPR